MISREMLSDVVAAELRPLHNSLRLVHESISCLASEVLATHGRDILGPGERGARVMPSATCDDRLCHAAVSLDIAGESGRRLSHDAVSLDIAGESERWRGGAPALLENGAQPEPLSEKPDDDAQLGLSSMSLKNIARGRSSVSSGGSTSSKALEPIGIRWSQFEEEMKLRFVEPAHQRRRTDFVEGLVFQNVSAVVIWLNSLFVAYTSDWEMQNMGSSAPGFFDVVDNIFLLWYIIELTIRLAHHRCYFFVNKERWWNLMDFVLVFFSTLVIVLGWLQLNLEVGNVMIIRIIRLSKVGRIIRTIRVMKEFREFGVMWQSFVNCSHALMWSLVMVFFVIFLFALIFMQGLCAFLKQHDVSSEDQWAIESSFGGVPASMMSLYKVVTGGGDWAYYHDIVKLSGKFYDVLFLLFIFGFIFAFLNILTGVFVEKAVALAQPDREHIILEECRKKQESAKEFRHICSLLDHQQTGTISRAAFMDSMKNVHMQSYMAATGIEIKNVALFFDMLGFSEDNGTYHDEVSIERFVEGCMNLRGAATSFDMQKLLSHVDSLIRQQCKEWTALGGALQRLDERLDRFGGSVQVRPLGSSNGHAASAPDIRQAVGTAGEGFARSAGLHSSLVEVSGNGAAVNTASTDAAMERMDREFEALIVSTELGEQTPRTEETSTDAGRCAAFPPSRPLPPAPNGRHDNGREPGHAGHAAEAAEESHGTAMCGTRTVL